MSNATPAFAFNEVHFRLKTKLKAGDTIQVQNSSEGNLEHGVDFLEIEEVPAQIKKSVDVYSVVDYGAISKYITQAKKNEKDDYIPAGTNKIIKTPVSIQPVEKEKTTTKVWVGRTVVKKILKKNRKATSAKITLKKIKNATGYKKSTNKKFKKSKTIIKNTKKFKVKIKSKKIAGAKKLYVKARAYKKNGKKITWGRWSKIKILTLKS